MSAGSGFLNYWRIRDRTSCAKAITNGAAVALFSAAVTAIFAGLAFLTRSADPALRLVLDPWNLVDVGVLLVLAYFVFQRSRAASTALVLYFVSAKALAIQEGAFNPVGAVIAMLVLAYYVNAMRGTFIWHKSYAAPADTV